MGGSGDYESGAALTLESLSKASARKPDLIQGSTLYAKAKEVERVAKKLLAYFNEYVGTSGCLPSGRTIEGAYAFVLTKMSSGPSDEGDDGDDANDAAELYSDASADSDRRRAFLTSGFIAFALFGPGASPDFRSALLEKDPAQANPKGRARLCVRQPRLYRTSCFPIRKV